MNSADRLNKSIIIEKFKHSWPVENWKSNGFFKEEYIHEINIHWLSFDPPDDSSFAILSILYIAIMSVGITGNVLVLFLYGRCKTLRTQGNVLIANLAVSDLLMMLKMPVFVYNALHKGPALGNIACRIYGFIGGLTGVVSIVTLGAISLDRYFVIKFPLSRKYTKLRIRLCLLGSWIYALVFSAIPLLDIGLGKYQYEGYLTSCSYDYLSDLKQVKVFILCFFVAGWMIPFLLISFCYFNIVQVVAVKSFSRRNDKDTFRHVKDEDKHKQEVKLAIIVFSVIILWFISWTPYATISLLGISGNKHLITPFGSMIPAVLCKTASCVDPFIYALSHPKFKQEMKRMFFRSSNTPKEHKVWFTETTKSRKKSFKTTEPSDVEEDVIEVELKNIPFHDATFLKDSYSEERKMKKLTYYSKLLCLRPNFSNRSSRFRKIVRRLSKYKKELTQE